MSDNDAASADPLGQIADEFVEAFRQGKRPSVEEFARRYPEHADDLRDMLPALVLMEKAKSADGASGQPRPARAAAVAAPVQQLGDYQILREVSRGGMGVVYEAQQLSLGRHVAIKVLPSHALLNPRQLGRFQREARSAAKLHHTNIVPVFGVGEQDGLHYCVTHSSRASASTWSWTSCGTCASRAANRRRRDQTGCSQCFRDGHNDEDTAERATKACSLLPSTDKAELEAALALGGTGVKVGKSEWALLALGMAEYRSGNYADADTTLLDAAEAGKNTAWVTSIAAFYRAMSLFRLGKSDRKVARGGGGRMARPPRGAAARAVVRIPGTMTVRAPGTCCGPRTTPAPASPVSRRPRPSPPGSSPKPAARSDRAPAAAAAARPPGRRPQISFACAWHRTSLQRRGPPASNAWSQSCASFSRACRLWTCTSGGPTLAWGGLSSPRKTARKRASQ